VHRDDDTIAAVATGRGPAALGIVRITGPDSARVLAAVVPGTRAVERPRRMVHGRARDPSSDQVIDEILCYFAPGPKTATGQDVAEIHGHGGPLVLGRLLDATLRAGARPANPGEFTARAFLGGRLDLTQAEAVMTLIGARSERAARTAVANLQGRVAERLGRELDRLTEVAAQVEAGLDFPDEDLPLDEAARLAAILDEVSLELESAADSYALGARLADGARVAIVGPTNAGKSSLLNRLVDEERALVDHEPGTTRDVVEGQAEIDGIPIVFRDTAGLRDTSERVETRGIERSREAATSADLCLIVIDGAEGSPGRCEGVEELISVTGSPAIVAINKNDLGDWSDRLPAVLDESTSLPISALTGHGLPELKQAIAAALGARDHDHEPLLVTARQHTAVSRALERTSSAAQTLRRKRSIELAAIDLSEARRELASLWGRDAGEEVIDAIFSSFCLGK
jgi:tRNA modification GTPase